MQVLFFVNLINNQLGYLLRGLVGNSTFTQ